MATGQTVTAEVSGYVVRIERNSPYERECVVSVSAVLSDAHGNQIGEVGTEIIKFAPNSLLAHIKAYRIGRNLENGTLIPELDF